jgi:bifunctional DNase/RNase
MKKDNTFVPVDLVRILISECDGDHQIVFREKKGGRELSISIGPFEALAIRAAVNQQEPLRPMTHDLMQEIIRSLGASLKKIQVDHFVRQEQMASGTFHGKLVLTSPSGEKIIDARPSDAVALAVRFEAPIEVAESVFCQV